MPDSVPEDIGAWLAKLAAESEPQWGEQDAKQLQQVLKGKLLRKVFWKLAQRTEAMKLQAMREEGDDAKQLAELRRLQSETRGIAAVLELMWETAYEV